MQHCHKTHHPSCDTFKQKNCVFLKEKTQKKFLPLSTRWSEHWVEETGRNGEEASTWPDPNPLTCKSWSGGSGRSSPPKSSQPQLSDHRWGRQRAVAAHKATRKSAVEITRWKKNHKRRYWRVVTSEFGVWSHWWHEKARLSRSEVIKAFQRAQGVLIRWTDKGREWMEPFGCQALLEETCSQRGPLPGTKGTQSKADTSKTEPWQDSLERVVNVNKTLGHMRAVNIFFVLFFRLKTTDYIMTHVN